MTRAVAEGRLDGEPPRACHARARMTRNRLSLARHRPIAPTSPSTTSGSRPLAVTAKRGLPAASAERTWRLAFTAAALAVSCSAGGCDRGREPGAAPEPASSDAAEQARAGAAARGVQIVKAPASGDVAAIVRDELARARADGRDLVVYVGATWCEPCKEIHDAAEAGRLDAAFSTLRLLEFDLDRDEARLAAAGYTTKLVPLFVAPGEDGRATDNRFAGSYKGHSAVAVTTPRLERLLARARDRR